MAPISRQLPVASVFTSRAETYGITAASVDRPGDRPALSSVLVVKMALDVQALLINMAFFTFLNSVEPGQHERETWSSTPGGIWPSTCSIQTQR